MEGALPGHDMLVESWHVEHGLPDANITALAQTPEGYLWVGTFNGLARFDGVRFTIMDARRAPGLAARRITGLLADHAGRLWVADESGALFRGESGRFEPGPGLSPTDRTTPVGSTHSRWLRGTGLAEDALGGIWMQTDGGRLARVADGAAKEFSAGEGLPAGGVVALAGDPSRRPWALVGDRLLQWEEVPADRGTGRAVLPAGTEQPGTGTRAAHFEPRSSPPAAGRWVERWRAPGLSRGGPALGAGPADNVWLAVPRGSWITGGGRVLRFRGGRLEDSLPPTPWTANSPRSQVTAVLEDRAGRVWLGTHWGGVLRSEGEGAWLPPLAGGVLAQCRVTCLFEDQQGAIWVGTLSDGLHRLTRRPVAALRLPPPAKDHLVNTVCTTRDGGVWVGTDGAGAFRYAAGAFTHYGVEAGLGSALVLSFCEDGAGELWCGTATGLCRWREGRFERLAAPEANLGYAVAMLADRTGNLWFGTPQGVVRHQAGRFTLHGLGVEGAAEIRALAEDSAGDLWIGTVARGLFRLSGGRVERFGPAAGLTHPDARALWCDATGGVWVGTLGGGLFRGRVGRFEAITTADGRADATINGMITDGAGRLWCCSYNGIFGVPLALLDGWLPGGRVPLACRRLSLAEGLDHRACSGAGKPVVSRAPDGMLWFVNQRSVGVLDPALASEAEAPPRVVIESATVDGVEQPARTGETLVAASSARRLEFRYTALGLARPAEARFRHRLREVDADWIYAGQDRAAYYGQLPHGRYVFEVAAAGADGTWRAAAGGLAVEIRPRLWERASVRAGAGLLLLGGVAAAVGFSARARLRRRLAALERQRALEQERSRIARDMHDELGAGLTRISLLTALAQDSADDPAEVRAQGGKIAHVARSLVQALDEIVWAVRPQNDNLESLVEYLGQATRDLCEGSGVRCWFAMPPAVPAVEVPANARHNLILACREAVNNVLKHSGATELRMSVRLEERRLTVELADNGRGFEVAGGEARRSGLTHMRARLAEVGGHCTIQSAPTGGTTVRLALPLAGPT